MKSLICNLGFATSFFAFTQASHAVVFEFTSRPAWEVATGEFTTIDFLGFPPSTIITTQYESSGVSFTDGNDAIRNPGMKIFLNDGSGLAGADTSFDPDVDINVSFLSDVFTLGIDYPGALRIELYHNNNLIYTSSDFGGTGVGFFAGLVSTDPFDSAILIDWNKGKVFIDDLHFGVPSPGALPLIGFALFLGPRRGQHG